jgi:hypothetical protein
MQSLADVCWYAEGGCCIIFHYVTGHVLNTLLWDAIYWFVASLLVIQVIRFRADLSVAPSKFT